MTGYFKWQLELTRQLNRERLKHFLIDHKLFSRLILQYSSAEFRKLLSIKQRLGDALNCKYC